MDNYDFLNSSPETQLELMNTMLQLDQLTQNSDFSSSSSNLPRTPQSQNFFSPNQPIQPFYMNQAPLSSTAAMREMIYHIAAMQPVHIDPESVKPPKRKNVKISKDPQSVAARLRREKISERIRILQRLVPGGTKMDTASMLDEAINYVKFLKSQIQSLERVAVAQSQSPGSGSMGYGNNAPAYQCYQKPDHRYMGF
ncbi:hypothetical protein LUZ63_001326 [Rhynchospora breviuscula]|uniref:BHLH domain-containing protein n=1 Tax=Rhynchospora breviuscula TaxID=2022672 RepID=A0A9Q0HWY7_9POAL|nr:hypothetical protein LUZ63_001326 [Rhynchospora breviuscula]